MCVGNLITSIRLCTFVSESKHSDRSHRQVLTGDVHMWVEAVAKKTQLLKTRLAKIFEIKVSEDRFIITCEARKAA